jgi:uncharacterized protein YycO
MKSIQAIFCNATKGFFPRVASYLIRFVTWGKWAHVALIVDNNEVVSATWPRVKLMKLDQLKKTHGDWAIVEIPCKNPDKAVKWARSIVGLKYDTMALFGILIHHDYQSPLKWFCSESFAVYPAKGDSPIFRDDVKHTITPQMGWIICRNVIDRSH